MATWCFHLICDQKRFFWQTFSILQRWVKVVMSVRQTWLEERPGLSQNLSTGAADSTGGHLNKPLMSLQHYWHLRSHLLTLIVVVSHRYVIAISADPGRRKGEPAREKKIDPYYQSSSSSNGSTSSIVHQKMSGCCCRELQQQPEQQQKPLQQQEEKVANVQSSSKRKKPPKSSFSMGFRRYVRHFRGAILEFLRPSLPWCFPIRGPAAAAKASDFGVCPYFSVLHCHGVFPSGDQQQQQQKPLQRQ